MGEGTEISIGSLSELNVAGDLGAATLLNGRDEQHDRQVMVVLFHLDQDERIELFRNRFRASTLISRVASPYTAGHAADDRQYFVLPSSEDFVLADDIDSDLRTANPSTRPSPKQLQDFFLSLCRVVTELHDRDCPHGFLDPKLICRTRSWKLASLGGIELQVFADRAIDGAELDRGYCAPERTDAEATVSGDVYSLGMILRDLGDLAGHDLDDVVARATATNPADRHVSVDDLLIEALDHLERQPAAASPATASPNPQFAADGTDQTPAPPTQQLPIAITPIAMPETEATAAPPADPAQVDHAVAEVAAEPAVSRTGRRFAPFAMSLIAGIAIGAIAIGGYVLLSDSRDGPDATTVEVTQSTGTAEGLASATSVPEQPTTPAETTSPTATSVPATATPEPTLTESAPTPVVFPSLSRTATLYADPANLRAAASVNSPLVASLVGARGTDLEVISPIMNGWYQVEHRDGAGWIFGAFVIPADAGYVVVEHRDGLGESISLLNQSGAEIAAKNPTANVALVTDTTADLWEVLLPDGRAAWIDPFFVVRR